MKRLDGLLRLRPHLPPFWLVFTFWTLVAAIAAAQVAPHHDSMVRGAAFELLNHWAWAALTPAVFILAHRFPLDRTPRAGSIVVHVGAGMVVGLGWGTFSRVLHQHLAHPAEPASSVEATFMDVLAFGFSTGLLIYLAVLGAAHAFWYYRESRERQGEALALRTQLAEARLETLRMQIQPHFLFNTLNTVSGLVESDPDTTRGVVARLSRLLRHTLDSSDEPEIPLWRELELLSDYVGIVRARFGDRIEIRVDVDDAALDASVPPLCLQPLVENAVEHGVGRRSRGGVVEVRGRCRGDRLVLEVVDDGVGLSNAPGSESGGLGVRNLEARLEHLHADAARVRLKERPSGGTVARMELPFSPVGQECHPR